MESVTQGDLLDRRGIGILRDRRIDEEQHRHVHFLARLECLFGEQKHCTLLKYPPVWSGETLKLAWPVTGTSELFFA